MKNLRHIISIVYLVFAVRLGSVGAEGGGEGSIRGRSDENTEEGVVSANTQRKITLNVANKKPEKQPRPGLFNDIKSNNGNGSPNGPKFHKALQPIPGKYIVVLEDTIGDNEVDDVIEDLINYKNGIKGKSYRKALKGFSVALNKEEDAIALSERNEVKFVEEDGEVHADASWGLDRIDQHNLPLDSTYSPNGDGTGVTAYIIDTGIHLSHDEFGNRATWGTNTVDRKDRDCDGHGTHVAGTVGGATYGFAKNVSLVAVKVLNCKGSGTTSGVIAGVDWVANDHTASDHNSVANMSLGGELSKALNDAVNGAVAAGVVFAVSAGNSNIDACSQSPASAENATTVGSTTHIDSRSSFSNYGECVDIFAPGSAITSAWIGGNAAINTISGTSMASPHVAGIAAIYFGNDPTLSWEAVTAKMTVSASPNRISSPGAGSPNLLAYVDHQTPPPQCTSDGNACMLEGSWGSCSGVCESSNCVLSAQNNYITFFLTTDNYPDETSWELRDSSGSIIASRNTGYYRNPASNYCEQVVNLQENSYEWTINDAYGDGICCSYGNGSYNLYQGNTELPTLTGGEFDDSESTSITVGSGTPSTCGDKVKNQRCRWDDQCHSCSCANRRCT